MTSIVEHEMDPRNLLAYAHYLQLSAVRTLAVFNCTMSMASSMSAFPNFGPLSLSSIILTLIWRSLLAGSREQGETLRYADHVSTR